MHGLLRETESDGDEIRPHQAPQSAGTRRTEVGTQRLVPLADHEPAELQRGRFEHVASSLGLEFLYIEILDGKLHDGNG
jgi:hypothetical protein